MSGMALGALAVAERMPGATHSIDYAYARIRAHACGLDWR
jgi:hypothetical protein